MFGAMVEAFTPGFLSAKKTKAVSFVEPAEELVGKTDGELVGKIDEEVVEELVDEVAKELVEAAEKPDAVKPVEATIEDPGGKAKKPSLVARLKSLSPIPRKKHSK